ncbi:MAG: T9SS type A sorting domain-containing protein [Bacteroidia bacterium]
MRGFQFIFVFLLLPVLSMAQYAPRDNWPGSTAVPGDSSIFINWAKQVRVTRGFVDIRNPQAGKVQTGLPEMTLSYPDGQAVSLGDGGMAVLEFEPAIVNGPGADFAVFENGFHIKAESDSDFLELAFVEVSSDGINWVRFAALSDNDTLNQLGTFDGSRANKVHNLAGKYVGNFGTPFDLEELKDSLGIDVMAIRFVRIIDVVGSLNDSFVTRDSRGYKVNDPFPTPFAQGGFDLDAVGVIYNQHSPNGIEELAAFRPYPNPLRAGQAIQLAEEGTPLNWTLYSLAGKKMEEGKAASPALYLVPGHYFMEVHSEGRIKRFSLVIQ